MVHFVEYLVLQQQDELVARGRRGRVVRPTRRRRLGRSLRRPRTDLAVGCHRAAARLGSAA